MKHWRIAGCGLLATVSVLITLLIVLCLRATWVVPYDSFVLRKLSNASDDFVDSSRNGERLKRFAGALRFETVSYAPGKGSPEALLGLLDYLVEAFPLVHSTPWVSRQIVNNYSVLYTVEGSSPYTNPYMLAAHLDVVPVDGNGWSVPAFNGTVQNGYLYGRGTIDCKHSVMGILEALQFVIESGRRPRRTIYIAFGHDEEVLGKEGALEIARALRDRGVSSLDFILDEGYFVFDGFLPGVSRPVALIAVTEKGWATVELKCHGTARHSSVPPAQTSIGILAGAVSRLEANPEPERFGYGPERIMIENLAPHATFWYRVVYTNMWLFRKVMAVVMTRDPSTNAIARTTTAVTIFRGGNKDNVVPAEATALVNHRIHPSQTVDEVVARDRSIIDDPRVQVRLLAGVEPHPVSPHGLTEPAYVTIAASIKSVFPNAIVAPGVLIGNTDTKHYLEFSKKVYRHSPAYFRKEDLNRLHGNDERISLDNYDKVVQFYYRVIRNADRVLDIDLAKYSTPDPEL